MNFQLWFLIGVQEDHFSNSSMSSENVKGDPKRNIGRFLALGESEPEVNLNSLSVFLQTEDIVN